MTDVAIRVDHLFKQYRVTERQGRYRTIREAVTDAAVATLRRRRRRRAAPPDMMWALDDISFEIATGDVVGVIGRNGAGKSTLLKVLSRITEPTRGRATIHGRVGSLLEVGTGFHNELTGRENIFLNGAILGMRKAEIARQFDQIVSFAEVERFVDTPVKHYSTGMYLRLAFAVAAHLDPDILLVDEVLAVGDVAFQSKCLGKMQDVARHGRTVLFVSHNMGAIRSLCRTGLVLNKGTVAYSGDVGAAVEHYYRLVGALREKPEEATPGRAGFGPVTINEGAVPVKHSDGFVASTTLRVPESATGYTLHCTVNDMHGRRLFTHVHFEGMAEPGIYSVRASCPPLFLATGLYSLHFKALFQGSYGSARALSDHVPLDVVGAESRFESVLVPPVDISIARSAAHG